MFKFVREGKKYLVQFPNEEIRELLPSEIDSFYERVNKVIEALGLKNQYIESKEQKDTSLIDFAIEMDIDLDACLYAVLSHFRLEKINN
ncbi:MAG: hypothetical protein U0354_10655 [Candidatus Sericytochromatia bacterium]